jgi:squalene-associated FAD-dependent desaturase
LSPEPSSVAVIGGGFAGLSAAVALARAGVKVTVLEARGRLGGRASAYQDRETGEWVDNGQHVLAGCYDETFRFLAEIGAGDLVALQPRLEVGFIDGAGAASVLRCPNLPAPFHLAAGVLGWSGVSWRDRLALARVGPALKAGADAGEGDETVYHWLTRHRQTPRLIEMLWEPLALAALNQPMRQARAAPFVRVLARMFGGRPRDAALGLPRVSLDHLYAAPARSFIEARGGEVRLHALARLTVERGAISSLTVRDEPVPMPDAVIVAAPWFALSALVRDVDGSLGDLLARANATAASPIVTVNLWFDTAIVDRPFVGLPGRVMQWVFDKAQLYTEKGSGVVSHETEKRLPTPFATHLSLVSSGADEVLRKSNDELIALALDELRAALPTARRAVLLRATVVREPQATFSLAPGQPPRPSTRTPVRNLWLAGDWVDTGLPSTIESAVLSGRLAAEALLQDVAHRL